MVSAQWSMHPRKVRRRGLWLVRFGCSGNTGPALPGNVINHDMDVQEVGGTRLLTGICCTCNCAHNSYIFSGSKTSSVHNLLAACASSEESQGVSQLRNFCTIMI
ncbi:hypothetical protein E2C01_004587 [Portunus trituberculatus]|uniref:Uncharacterized protein n=1 Tax=Portunus trituberculatus TaxID=210409 RepID=A0A5B7CQD1_PORTR|nr:hypothetical protein [Portunus trituberculatus]